MTTVSNALIDQIMAVMEESFDPQWGEAWNARQLRDALAMPTTFAYLIDPDGKQCDPRFGYGAGFLLARAAPGEEEILLIAVRPRYREQGLARKLIDRHCADAIQRGAEKLFLEMRCNNPAEKFYLGYGFKPIGLRKNYYLTRDGTRLDAKTFAIDLDR